MEMVIYHEFIKGSRRNWWQYYYNMSQKSQITAVYHTMPPKAILIVIAMCHGIEILYFILYDYFR